MKIKRNLSFPTISLLIFSLIVFYILNQVKASPEVFSDGFESGNFINWDSTIDQLNSDLGTTTDISNEESYSANVTVDTPYGISDIKGEYGGHATFTKYFSDSSEIYTRFYFYLADTSGLTNWNNDSHPITIATHTVDNGTVSYYANSVFLWKDVDNQTVYIGMKPYRNNQRYTFNFTGKAIQENMWYCVEFRTNIGSGTGEVELTVDGTQEFIWTGLSNDNAGNINRTRIGIDASPGDIVGGLESLKDGVVDIRDTSLSSKCFGGEYDPRADITGTRKWVPDGTCDIRDVSLVSIFFGAPSPASAGDDNIQIFFDSVIVDTSPIGCIGALPSQLTSQLRNVASCPGSEICVFSMFNYTNSHAGDCSYGDWKVCVDDPTVILTSNIRTSPDICFSGEGGVISLYQTTNSHAEQYLNTVYPNHVCLNASSGTLSCSYKPSCASGEACLASLAYSTNSHVGDCDEYSRNICCGYSSTPCDLEITSASPPPMTRRGNLANATVNVTNNGGSACYAYVECEYEDPPPTNDHLVWQGCPQINPGSIYTFYPGMIVDELGTWNVTYCSVNASFDDTCGTLVTHDIYWDVGTFEDVECLDDTDCEPYQKCDCPGANPLCTGTRHENEDWTCYDFRPECIGCYIYDFCTEGIDPNNPAQGCCNDTAGPPTGKECCLLGGVPVLNCSLPGAVRNTSVTVHPDFCYVEGYDITDVCVDLFISPHNFRIC